MLREIQGRQGAALMGYAIARTEPCTPTNNTLHAHGRLGRLGGHATTTLRTRSTHLPPTPDALAPPAILQHMPRPHPTQLSEAPGALLHPHIHRLVQPQQAAGLAPGSATTGAKPWWGPPLAPLLLLPSRMEV